MFKNVEKETLIRTVILILALINNLLMLIGKTPIPVDDEMVANVISFVFTAVASIWAWWKNNSFTDSAIKADHYLKELREKKEK